MTSPGSEPTENDWEIAHRLTKIVDRDERVDAIAAALAAAEQRGRDEMQQMRSMTSPGKIPVTECVPPWKTPAEVQQDDVRYLLHALGLDYRARPYSPHSVIHREILPAIKALTAPPESGRLDPLPCLSEGCPMNAVQGGWCEAHQ